MADRLARPPGWNASPVWGHVDQMWTNIQASHAHLVAPRKRLEAIGALFDEVCANWSNPEQRIGAMLFIRTLSAFRVSVALGMCSPVEMYPVLRLCIECAGYAHAMARDESLQSVWLRRSESEERARLCRKAFAPEKIKASLKLSDPDLERIYTTLCDHAITLGAHPNELSVTLAINIGHSEDRETRREEIVMLPAGSHTLEVAMVTAARVGVCALLIFGHVLPKRYEEIGIGVRIAAQRQGL